MYHKHSTEGIVIRGRERGEGNKIVVIFSKEFGLIYANVQNVRSITSKLRGNVEYCTVGNFSLVKGHHGWKLVGAESRNNFWTGLPTSEKRVLAFRVMTLLSKLVGEEKNERLYSLVDEFIYNLGAVEEKDIKSKEFLILLQILKNLGYIKEDEKDLEKLSADKKQATETINNSLKAANLL